MPVTRRDFVRSLFAASQTALVGRLLSSPLHADETFTADLNFAVIGDWGRQGRPDQMEVAQQMGIACKNAGAAFVISVGDNFYEHGVTSLQDDHWNLSFENVYTAPSLQVPWYVVLGNHDYAGKTAPQLLYTRTSRRWTMPARYYKQTFTINSTNQVDCFFLDTCPFVHEYYHNPLFSEIPKQDPNAQLQWLYKSLAASTAPWKLVFGHHPIYSSGLAHGNQPEMIDHILPLLQQYKVQAYFAGHDHDLEHLKVGNLDLIVSGAGSEHRPVNPFATTPFHTDTSGFAIASMTAKEMKVRFIDNKGTKLYETTVPRNATV
jgi:tartrate-resistant acid phosphatase type 5